MTLNSFWAFFSVSSLVLPMVIISALSFPALCPTNPGKVQEQAAAVRAEMPDFYFCQLIERDMTIKAIFFDVGDTLYHNPEFRDAQSKQPIKQLSEARGITYEEAKALFKKTREELKNRLPYVTKVAVMGELGISRLEMHRYMARLNPKEFLQPDKRLGEILKRLGRRYELGIITNVLEELLDKVLDALGIDKSVFRYVVSVDNTKNSKPHEEPFLKALELAGVKAEECIYVGDSLGKDIAPAKRIGMKTIWISGGQELPEDVSVDASISSIYEVEDAVSRIK